MRVADYIVERLVEENINHVFMLTGRGILFLSDAVAKCGQLEGICVHHEQAGAYAAVAYAQATENLGACLVSTGCGSFNTITGLLCAWQDAVPCIFISGQNMLNETVRYTQVPIRTYGSQEADIISVIAPITKYATMLTDPDMIAYEMDKAFYYAKEGKKGPVWIDVPLDIQNMRVDPQSLRRFLPEKALPLSPSEEDIRYVKDALKNSKRPAILIGSGVRAAGAVAELKAFSKNLEIPVVYAPSACDVYGSDNELSIGAVGSLGGSREGNFVVQNSDLLIIIGHRMTSVTTGPDFDKFAREAKVIVVDIDAAEFRKKTIKVDRLILSDAKAFLLALSQQDIGQTNKQWREKCLHWKRVLSKSREEYPKDERVNLYYLAECLTNSLQKDAVVLSDAGYEELIIPSAVRFKDGQKCIHPISQGAMGFALPAALGAYFAGNSNVVAIIGDGSIMMNIQELLTIRYYNIPIKVIVTSNNMYSVIRKRQVDLFRTRTIGTDPSNGVACPNFQKIAAAFGISYIRIDNGEELEKKLGAVLHLEGPVICEVMCKENQEYLHCSYARNSSGRISRRPLEDLAPFIDRELFKSEMIIKPLDC